MKTEKRTTKKTGRATRGSILNVTGVVILVLAVALCLCLTVPRVCGITSYTVLTGSMEPAIPVGSMVWAKSTEPSTLVPGDIVVFYDGTGSVPVTHRVVDNDPNERTITTQGDANSAPDVHAIPYQNIVGKVVLHLPGVGTLLAPLGTLWGKLCLIAIILAALFLALAGRDKNGDENGTAGKRPSKKEKGPKSKSYL